MNVIDADPLKTRSRPTRLAVWSGLLIVSALSLGACANGDVSPSSPSLPAPLPGPVGTSYPFPDGHGTFWVKNASPVIPGGALSLCQPVAVNVYVAYDGTEGTLRVSVDLFGVIFSYTGNQESWWGVSCSSRAGPVDALDATGSYTGSAPPWQIRIPVGWTAP